MYSPLPAYAELHCLSNFTFLRGASHPRRAGRARAQAGLRRAGDNRRVLGRRRRARPRGREETPRPQAHHRQRNPARGRARSWCCSPPTARATAICPRSLRSAARERRKAAIASSARDLDAWVARLPGAAGSGRTTPILEQARFVAECFPGRAWIAAELLGGPNDRARLRELDALGKSSGLPLVAAGDVHMHVRSRRPLQDVLTAIRLGVPVATSRLRPPSQRRASPAATAAARANLSAGAARRNPGDRRALRFRPRQPALRISRRNRARRDTPRPPICGS